jgi:F0F1-type ATP synthase membrane subunit c/vacuolar-type H+-ATPase subunit K
MRRRAVTWLAWSLVGLPAVLLLCGISLSVAANSVSTRLPYDIETIFTSGAINLITLLPFSVIGALIVSRQPRNVIGWIYCGVGLLVGLTALAHGYAEYWLASGSGIRSLAETAAWFGSWSWIPLVLVPTSLLLLLFPDGRVLSPRWRVVAWCAGFGIVGYSLNSALETGGLGDFPKISNPYGVDSPLVGMVGLAGVILAGCSTVASAVSLIVRMRRADSEQRQQIKWFAYGGVVVVSTIVASGFVSIWSVPASILIISVALLGLPVFTGIAILQYRLYDIDIIINRTLVYGSLTIMLAAVYFAGVVGTQYVFRAVTGQERLPQLAVVVSTLAIAAMFNPLRRRLQAFIDRRFYRSKYDAAKTLEAFSSKLRDETDLDTLSDDLISVVRDTIQPAHISLWLRPDMTSIERRQTDN